MELIKTERAPTPRGHYSQAVVHQGVVYVAGQLPWLPGGTDTEPPESVGDQTRLVLSNIQAILEAAGSGLQQVIQMTVYVSQPEHWGEVNAAYAEVMGDHRPARAVVPVTSLHGGAALEVQVVAAVA